MIEFLKSKGTSFVNKPVGVNNVNTGAVEAGQTLARVGQQLATQFFADAEKEQIKLGKEVGLNLAVRDVNGNLVFQETPTSLSAVAQNAAEPIINKRYEDALNVDIFSRINEIRNKSKTSSQFQNNVRNEMSSYIEQTKLSGGNRYVGSITETIAKLSAQHLNAMATEETKQAMRISSLQALQITNMNTNDLLTLSTQDLISSDSQSIYKTITDIKENQKVLTAHNDNNFKINNLDLSKYTVADINSKTVVDKALANTLMKNKTSAEILEIQQYFESNEIPKHLLNKNNEIDPKSKIILQELMNSPYRKEIKEFIKKRQDLVNEQQNRTRSDKNYNDKVTKENLADYKNSTDVKIDSENWLSGKVEEVNKIANELINSESISEEQKAKLNKWERSVVDASSETGIVVDGKRIMIGTKKAMNTLTAALLNGIENTILMSGEFKTGERKEHLRNALTNLDSSNLSDNEKKIYNQIINITSSSLRGPTLRRGVATALNDNISNQNAISLKAKQQKIFNNTVDAAFGKPNAPAFANTTKEQEILNQAFGNLTPSYYENEYEEGLRTGDTKALSLNTVLNRGNFPSSFVSYLTKAVSSNNSRQIKTALGLYNKYTQVDVGGQRVNRLQKTIDPETYALLTIASDMLPAYEGQVNFFGVEGLGPNGTVTQGQMMTKIREIYRTREAPQNKDIYKANLNSIIGDFSNSFTYLQGQGFDNQEANELRFIVDASASMGLSKEETQQIIEYAKEGIYLDGEGLIFDTLSSGSNTSRSKSSFKAVFDEDKAPYIRSFIQSKLNELEHFNEKGRKVGSFVLNYKPTQVIDGKVQYSIGTDVGAVDIDVEDTIVQLQPLQYGSAKTDVRYVAVTKNPNTGFMRPIRKPDGSLLAFDANDLSQGVPTLGDDSGDTE
jgi:hypothetical protein